MDRDVVIGIDGGGTNTRVLICDLKGNKLAFAEGGSASKYKDENASDHVKATIEAALAQAGRVTADVAMLVAGIAGYESEADDAWITSFTDLPGLNCPKLHLNDSDIAHAGALQNRPGIIAIAGTGTMIMGINESGMRIRNSNYHQYAYSAARHLAYDAVFGVLGGHRDDSNEGLIAEMLQHWQAKNLEQFQEFARQGFHPDTMKRNQLFGQFAPQVTRAANQGSSVARRVCNRAAEQLQLGIELVGSNFDQHNVEVALIGSVICSTYMREKLTELLIANPIKQYQVVEPQFSPVVGAILLANKELGISLKEMYRWENVDANVG
ncbi:BadF/BadG/BcrA/BcrD ATPase family protein [Paenibacillus guangzhouensis]|uniref:BadF/BadG/BcrA/BcrD ATPase family protein n=1 Tax=Paenibacillus guangzhouensis TaxID=1473112 RepID=UPI001266BA6F|nr:BadF/BadG/BcrA/BcrD ATPase family protein [Paenibacillus guangzhouensis]